MIRLPHFRSPSSEAVQSILREFLRPVYPPGDYRRLREENLRRAASCVGRPALRGV